MRHAEELLKSLKIVMKLIENGILFHFHMFKFYASFSLAIEVF